ncbi:iron-sulfur cluster carrier protein ApbC [Microbacteriaceae bacterium K1510]|nr:iron-sulfur cluster carrier protein ApbC [Microbacteriaceae bacterium K1510]
MAVTKEQVLAALATVKTPGATTLVDARVLSDVMVTDGKVFFSITVNAADVKAWEPVREAAEKAVRAVPGVVSALVALTAERAAGAGGARAPSAPPSASGPAPRPAPHQHAHPAEKAQPGIPGVEAIIAVASGKGGVGKSTTAVNLALGLRDLGLKVGVLDADIYGPSLPKLLAIKEKPQTIGGNRLKPIERYGLTVMSIGFLIDEETPMIWRGPMVMSAITQMLREVEWGKLDVLVVDMPPGTGDAQLTMAQQVPLKGAVIVSTPQDLALIDARRGVAMFKRVNVPVLGVVENMSYFMCPHCGTRSDIFGHGGARHEAERLGVAFLGEVPLHMEIREKSDAGLPVVATDPDGVHAKIYRDIAAKVLAQIKGGGAGRTAPKIVIEA